MPNARFGVCASGTSCEAVKDDVKPDTDMVTETDAVSDALKLVLVEPVTTLELKDDENDDVNDDDSAVLMSGPEMMPKYSPEPGGVSVSDAESITVPTLEPLETV